MEDPGSAIWAMIIMIIILTIVMIFFCMVPFYKALEKRWNHWDDLENDPRWNADSFQFSPTSPQMARAGGGGLASNNKYNRLSVGSVGGNSGSSRSSSFRNKCALPRAEDQVEIKMPPAYADIFAAGAEGVETGSMGSPPAYYSNTPSPQEPVAEPPQVVVQVATPPPAGPVKKTYRKVKKTPVVPKPKPEEDL